jgi:hypothetical protein
MSDSSPTFQRKPRRKAPVITTSQDSPPKKKTVPPSPDVHDYASQSVPLHSVAAGGSTKKDSRRQQSRRQQRLQNPLLDLQAVECDSDGASVEGSDNSEDDKCVPNSLPPTPTVLAALMILFEAFCIFSISAFETQFFKFCTFRHLTDLSYVTNGKRFTRRIYLLTRDHHQVLTLMETTEYTWQAWLVKVKLLDLALLYT